MHIFYEEKVITYQITAVRHTLTAQQTLNTSYISSRVMSNINLDFKQTQVRTQSQMELDTGRAFRV